MKSILFENGTVVVDAAVIGEGFGLEPAFVQEAMRAGSLSSVCETGIGEDAGLHRLTFFYKNCRLRLVIDAAGVIINRAIIDFGQHPLPTSIRHPGTQ